MKSLAAIILLTGITLASCQTNTPTWTKLKVGFDDDFHDLALLDNNSIVAYSYGSGLIIKSNDSGLTWKQVHKTDSIYFEQIDFPSPQVGFICGNTNRILKTEDGGEHWVEILIDSIPENPLIYGMKFINVQTGYLSLIQRGNKGMESKILQTNDSGTSWNVIHSIPHMLLNIKLVNDELWASGQNILISNVDQKSWQIEYEDTTKQVGQIRDFILHNNTIVMSSFNGYIIRKEQKSVKMEQITKNRLRSIIHVKDEHLIAAGDNNKAVGNLFESHDRGKTWQKIERSFYDIHRLKVKDGIVWGLGKKDELVKFE